MSALSPIYRLLTEYARLVPVRLGLHAGAVGVEFSDVCAMPIRGCEIGAIRPDLAAEAADVQERADALSHNHYRWHYINSVPEDYWKAEGDGK